MTGLKPNATDNGQKSRTHTLKDKLLDKTVLLCAGVSFTDTQGADCEQGSVKERRQTVSAASLRLC